MINVRRSFLVIPKFDVVRQELSWTHYRLLCRIEEAVKFASSCYLDAHLKRLKEEWEKYQEVLSGKKEKKYKESKKVSTVEEQESLYKQPGLFDEQNLLSDTENG